MSGPEHSKPDAPTDIAERARNFRAESHVPKDESKEAMWANLNRALDKLDVAESRAVAAERELQAAKEALQGLVDATREWVPPQQPTAYTVRVFLTAHENARAFLSASPEEEQ